MKTTTAVAALSLVVATGCSRKGAGGPARVPAQAQSAVLDAQRYAELVKQDYVTKSDYEAKRAAAEALQAVVRADSAAIASAALNLDWATIRAPIAGRTGRLLVREGNLRSEEHTSELQSHSDLVCRLLLEKKKKKKKIRQIQKSQKQ